MKQFVVITQIITQCYAINGRTEPVFNIDNFVNTHQHRHSEALTKS